AKNVEHVLPDGDAGDYGDVVEALASESATMEWRRKLAVKAFQHVASYDTAIATYLRGFEDPFPDRLTVALTKRHELRYGEEPHQMAALYRQVDPNRGEAGGVVEGRQLDRQATAYVTILATEA